MAQSKMAARELARETLEALSCDLERLHNETENKYWNSLPYDAVSDKIAVQTLFKEVKESTKRAVKAHSSVPRQKN